MEPGLVERLEQFARGGGTIVATCRSGVADRDNRILEETLPGPLAELFGIAIEDYDSIWESNPTKVAFESGSHEVRAWADVLTPRDADVTTLATYTGNFYAGASAVTFNQHGRGQAVYVGCMGTTSFYDEIARLLVERAEIENILEPTPNVEVIETARGEERFLFVLNHGQTPVSVSLGDGTYQELLSEQELEGTATFEPYGVWILRRQK
jgi:beta-galactosidase